MERVPWDFAVSIENIPDGLVRAETTDCFLSREIAATDGGSLEGSMSSSGSAINSRS